MNVKKRISLIALKYENFFTKKPLVLNIELSHNCNLTCIHCGRIQDDVKGKVSYENVTNAIDTVDAPIIYFTGGEPFLFMKDLERSVDYALKKGKVVVIVTNGTLLEQQLENFHVDKENLVLMISVDGLKEHNDKIRGEGSFFAMQKGMNKAKQLGYHVWLNFTIYHSNEKDIETLVEIFKNQVEQFHFNMFFDFLGTTDDVDPVKIADRVVALKRKYKNILNPYLYFEVWKGKEIDCTPWGTVTFDAKGWKSPCYFAKGPHYDSYEKLMANVDWEKYVHKKGKECKNCKAHCGFEPTIYRNKKLLLKEIFLQIKN